MFIVKIIKYFLSIIPYQHIYYTAEKANDKIAKELKVQTDDLLDKALFTASCNMRNKFARSDG